ncbi:MAG: hypothetical protein JNN32_14485 [Flavobacteriales bacterium]|nr:hypothetical protein [Flavobacteriales bacterium]
MRGFFYGNWFIGLCAVALGVESALQQHVRINGPWYHLLVFSGCVAFYNHAYRAYLRTPGDGERARWFAEHAVQQRVVQVILISVVSGVAIMHRDLLFDLDGSDFVLVMVFPIVAIAYYGFGSVALRKIGLLKPFILGFVWAGVVTVFPVVIAGAYQGIHVIDTGLMARLFFKNMMFCAMIAVLFDIKDHAGDHRSQLRTFVVQRGLRTTLFSIVLPLTLLGLVTFLAYGYMHGFSFMRLFWNAVPFAAMLAVIFTLRKRRPVLYYLGVVDGLLLLKALCGSIGMVWF